VWVLGVCVRVGGVVGWLWVGMWSGWGGVGCGGGVCGVGCVGVGGLVWVGVGVGGGGGGCGVCGVCGMGRKERKSMCVCMCNAQYNHTSQIHISKLTLISGPEN